MKRIRNFILIGIIGTGLLGGCDGASSIEDPSSTHFVKFYGKDGDQTGVDMVTLPDGSIVLFGTTTPSDQGSTSQWYLVKADAKGTIIWEKEFGTDDINETASDIELTADGRLVAVGNYYTSAADRDILLKTFSLDGVEIKTNLRRKAGTDENAISVAVTSNGFIVVGSTNDTSLKPPPPSGVAATDTGDALQLRFDDNLVEFGSQWRQAAGFEFNDVSVRAFEISPGRFYLFGYTNAFLTNHSPTRPDYNYWYYVINNSGEIENFIFGGTTSEEKVTSVSKTSQNYLLAGTSYTQTGTSDIFILRLTSPLTFGYVPVGVPPKLRNGDSLMYNAFSIPLGLNVPEQTSVVASPLGGFYLLANEKNSVENQNWLLTKINDNGTIAWKVPMIYGGEGLDVIGSVKALPDGRLLIIGTMKTGKPDTGESKMTLIKVDAEGRLND